MLFSLLYRRPRVRPDGKMRVGVRIAGVGRYVGIGRTYRLAKAAAADLAYRRICEAASEKGLDTTPPSSPK